MTTADHSSNRVPFGLLQATGLLVDVSEVPRGAASGCICPSCRLPLVARHGEQHAWHFAHETRGVSGPARECDYSLWVAVTLMARQILATATSVRLPPFVIREFGAPLPRGGHAVHAATVTAGGVVSPKQVTAGSPFEGLRCDALLDLDTAHIAMCLHHPERPLPDLPSDRAAPSLQRVGIVAIDLAQVWAAVPAGGGNAVRNGLQRIVLDDVVGKRWLHHPREERVRRGLREQARRSTPSPTPLPSAPATRARPAVPFEPTPSRSPSRDEDVRRAHEAIEQLQKRVAIYRHFVCVSCGREWDAYDRGLQTCAGCGESIYVSPREPRPPPEASR